MKAWRLRAALIASLLLVSGAVALFAKSHWDSLYDDAFIYLRYVHNLKTGCGLSFNCGEPAVEGFSSPLFLLLLYLGGLFTWHLVAWTQILGGVLLAGALGLAVLAAAHRAFGARGTWAGVVAPVVVAAVLGLDHFVLLNAVIGLDAPIAMLAVTALLYAALSRSTRWTVALAVLAPLARPECLVLVALLPLLPWMRRARPLLVVAAGLALCEIARVVVFHDVVPNTYWAKAGGTARHATLGLAYIAEVFKDFPVVALAPLALLLPEVRRVAILFLAAGALWLAFFLRSGGDTFEYGRLFVPMVPALAVLAVHGVRAAAMRAGNARAVAIAMAVAGVGLAAYARSHVLAPVHGFANVRRWAAVGRYLKKHDPHATVATVPIGAISYFSGLRVIDLVGLTAPPIAKAGRSVPPALLDRKWIGHERHDTEWVAAQKPDLIVTTKFSGKPYTSLSQASAGFFADFLLLEAIKSGKLPYHVKDAEIVPGLHWLMFERDGGSR